MVSGAWTFLFSLMQVPEGLHRQFVKRCLCHLGLRYIRCLNNSDNNNNINIKYCETQVIFINSIYLVLTL